MSHESSLAPFSTAERMERLTPVLSHKSICFNRSAFRMTGKAIAICLVIYFFRSSVILIPSKAIAQAHILIFMYIIAHYRHFFYCDFCAKKHDFCANLYFDIVAYDEIAASDCDIYSCESLANSIFIFISLSAHFCALHKSSLPFWEIAFAEEGFDAAAALLFCLPTGEISRDFPRPSTQIPLPMLYS